MARTGTSVKLRKGMTVKLDTFVCFTQNQGGGRPNWKPLRNHFLDENGYVDAFRELSFEEKQEWYSIPRGMNDAGESRIRPDEVAVQIHRDEKLTVVKARVKGNNVLVSRIVDGKEQHLKIHRLLVTTEEAEKEWATYYATLKALFTVAYTINLSGSEYAHKWQRTCDSGQSNAFGHVYNAIVELGGYPLMESWMNRAMELEDLPELIREFANR